MDNHGIKNFIRQVFLEKFKDRDKGNIGVELEYPLLNLSKAPVDVSVCRGLMEHFLSRGFKVAEYDEDNFPAFIENSDGDVLSFDNSYNNFEFSMQYSDSLCSIAERFYKLYDGVQEYLLKNGHMLTGMGTNPYKKYITSSHVNFPVYNMVWSFLKEYRSEQCHEFIDFPAYLSSVQSHLDINISELPAALTLFAKLDFARAALFSNSPDFEHKEYLCYRDYLWQRSAFSITGNVGSVDEDFKNTDEIVDSLSKRTMFNRIRDGKYEIFSPIPLEEYFKTNDKEDIECYLSFKNVEVNMRGTLEIRSDCTQPVSDAFMPPAFNVGILYNIEKAQKITDEFLYGNTLPNSKLRELAVRGRLEFDEYKLSEYLSELVELAYDGLRSREKGEERLLLGLFERAETLSCPASRIMIGNIDEIIQEYGRNIVK